MGPPAEGAVDADDRGGEDFAVTVVTPLPAADAQAPEAGAAVDLDLETEPVDGPAAQPTLAHIGRYALKRCLGRGGLGAVWEAWDPLLSRTVAVKTLPFDGVAPPERLALDRLFLNEARAAAGLNHAHIVTVHDAGLSDHGAYIAMERLRGRDLREALRDGWRPTPAQAAQLARRVADALAYAHARGVVHCDVKPANIYLTRRGRPTLLDFGIARVAHGAGVPALDGVIAGSPHYLAPEQLRGDAVDGRTDVYALGVVLYEVLTGLKAFDGDSLQSIGNAVLHQAPPPPAHARNPEVDPALSAIVARAMARRPEDRPPNAAELSQALRVWQADPERATGREDDTATTTTVPPSEAPSSSPSRPHRRTLVAAGLALAAGVGWLAWSGARTAGAPLPAVPATAAMTSAEIGRPPASSDAATTSTSTSGAAAAIAPTASAPAATPAGARPQGANRGLRTGAATRTGAAPAASPPTGFVQLSISPAGTVEVDGRHLGVAPPLTRIELPAGPHLVIVRKSGHETFIAEVHVAPGRPTLVRHRFGR